jgi:Concanavalin A-like lectin/glucanases superfamily
MSPLLIALIPMALIAIVLPLCFVGCSFHTHSISSYGKFNDTIEQTPGLVAYWPLVEITGTTAYDAGPNANTPQANNGTYTQGQNVPYDPGDQSAAASGAVNIDQAGIVPGDQNSINNVNPCPYFDGGFVNVPWNAAINPAPPFTLEAWVRPHWTAGDVQNFPATRGVVIASNLSLNGGFGLFATPDNFWAAVVGIGSGFIVARPVAGSNQTILPDTTSYLVMTYDGTTLVLWVNPADTGAGPYAQAAASGFVPLASPTPLYIGTGRPDLPTPLFPFNGWIQDVALYNVVLDDATIETHFMNGNAMQMT